MCRFGRNEKGLAYHHSKPVFAFLARFIQSRVFRYKPPHKTRENASKPLPRTLFCIVSSCAAFRDRVNRPALDIASRSRFDRSTVASCAAVRLDFSRAKQNPRNYSGGVFRFVSGLFKPISRRANSCSVLQSVSRCSIVAAPSAFIRADI